MAVDRIWFTCCALHNWLLEADGLDEQWQSGVPSDWEGELGERDEQELRRYSVQNIPNAIQNLQNPAASHEGYDLSGMSFGSDVDLGIFEGVVAPGEICDDDFTSPANGVYIVRKLSQKFFRQKLVEHFDIVWRQNDLVWPQRTRRAPSNYP